MFGVSCGNAAPAFQMQERVFDQVAQLVQVFIVGPFYCPICSGRDNRCHPLIGSLFDDRITIVSLVGNQVLRREALDQAASLCAIRCGTLCNKDSDWHTMRIHGQMYLGVEPPFVRLMA
jgi:hypothetical protein